MSEGGTDDNAKGRGDGFAHAFSAQLGRCLSQHVLREKLILYFIFLIILFMSIYYLFISQYMPI